MRTSRSSLLGASRHLLFATIVLSLGAHRATAQSSDLSVLSAVQPGTHFHVGVSTTNLSLQGIVLAASIAGPATPTSLNGVPIVIDPVTAIPVTTCPQPFANAGNQSATERKWNFDVVLPPSLPSGLPVRLQAFLLSGTVPVQYDVTNGAVLTTQAAGSTEKVITVGTGGTSTLRARLYDADTRSLSPLTFVAQGIPAGAFTHWRHGPAVSSDGRFGATSLGYRTSGSQPRPHPTAVTILDRATSSPTGGPAAYLLPAPGVPGYVHGLARFRPGDNVNVWVLESTSNTASGCSDVDHDLVVYDVTTGTQVARHAIQSDPNPCAGSARQYTADDWTFDDTGSYAMFYSRNSSGSLRLEVFSVASATTVVFHGIIPMSAMAAPANFGNRTVAIPQSTRVVVHFWDFPSGGHVIRSVDLATLSSSAPLTGTSLGHTNLHLKCVTNGGIAVVQSANTPNTFRFMTTPATAGTPLTQVGSAFQAARMKDATIPTFANELIIGGNDAHWGLARADAATGVSELIPSTMTFCPNGPTIEFESVTTTQNNHVDAGFATGRFRTIHGGRGLVGYDAAVFPRLAVLDTQTMTFAYATGTLPNDFVPDFIF